jgi:hypothetical protein
MWVFFRTNTLEECVVSIFRIENLWARNSVSSSLADWTTVWKTFSSIILVPTRYAWHHILEDGILHSHHWENLKSCIWHHGHHSFDQSCPYRIKISEVVNNGLYGHFDVDYTQSVTHWKHTTSDSDSVNDATEEETAAHDEQGMGMEEVPIKFVSLDVTLAYARHETYCDIHGLTYLIWIYWTIFKIFLLKKFGKVLVLYVLLWSISQFTKCVFSCVPIEGHSMKVKPNYSKNCLLFIQLCFIHFIKGVNSIPSFSKFTKSFSNWVIVFKVHAFLTKT